MGKANPTDSADDPVDASRDRWGTLLFSGFIEKMGRGIVKNWKLRYFELYETRLVYFLKLGDKTPKGSFFINDGSTTSSSKLRPFSFYIKTSSDSPSSFETALSSTRERASTTTILQPSPPKKSSKLHLRGSDSTNKDDWMVAIRFAIEARREITQTYPREFLVFADLSTNSQPNNSSRVRSFKWFNPTIQAIHTYKDRDREWRNERDAKSRAVARSKSAVAAVPPPVLHLKVKKTTAILQKESHSVLSTSSPYCVITVGSTVVQTKTCTNPITSDKTLNPVWDESFTFDYNSSLRYALIEVWDAGEHKAKPSPTDASTLTSNLIISSPINPINPSTTSHMNTNNNTNTSTNMNQQLQPNAFIHSTNKAVFLGQCMIPLFEIPSTPSAAQNLTLTLGKRSHKSHVSGQLEVEIGLVRDVLDTTTAPSSNDDEEEYENCGRWLFDRVKNAGGKFELLIGELPDLTRVPDISVDVDVNVNVSGGNGDGVESEAKKDLASYEWDERLDLSTSYHYYFNFNTLVSQWEKPDGFDDAIAAALQASKAEDDKIVIRSRPRLDSQPPTESYPKTLNSKGSDKDGKRRRSRAIKIGSNSKMTLSWGCDDDDDDDDVDDVVKEEVRVVSSGTPSKKPPPPPGRKPLDPSLLTVPPPPPLPISSHSNSKHKPKPKINKHPFPNTMPPNETEVLEDMSWRVILRSSPDVSNVNSVFVVGVLMITNYRILFLSEKTVLSILDPSRTMTMEETLDVEIPIMLIAAVNSSNKDVVIRTKDSCEYTFNFSETGQGDVEDICECNDDDSVNGSSSISSSTRDSSSTMSSSFSAPSANETVKGKKRNQMTSITSTTSKATNIAKGLMSSVSLTNGFQKFTQKLGEQITSIVAGQNKDGEKKRKSADGKAAGLILAMNGKTELENFLLCPFSSSSSGSPSDDTPPPLIVAWTESQLDVVSGIFSEDGSGIRRFLSRINDRVYNAQFECVRLGGVHDGLLDVIGNACDFVNGIDGEDIKGDEEVVVSVCDCEWVDYDNGNGNGNDDLNDTDERGERQENTTSFKATRSWLTNTRNNLKAGWDVYDIRREFDRQGVITSSSNSSSNSKNWRISSINVNYDFCPTYPKYICVPFNVSDGQLRIAGKFRSRQRIPVLTYSHPITLATISRCSQPFVGLSLQRSSEDENLLEQLNRSSGNLKKNVFVIIDARPKVNAQVNQAAGKGYELSKAYPNSDLIFMNIGNIHTMRASVDTVQSICCGRQSNSAQFNSIVEETKWLHHIHRVLTASIKVSHLIARKGISCLVHCSDGWDRTAQIAALAQIIMDPYYRTIEGFAVLIEKEWLSFGHKFADRTGFHPSGGHNSEERSPVFHQFLDCVHQMIIQRPDSFEFNLRMVRGIGRHCMSGWFGTFLFNTMRERERHNLSTTSISIWSYIFLPSNRQHFTNNNYARKDGVIMIDGSMKRMRLWREWFMKWHDDEFGLLWAQDGVAAGLEVEACDWPPQAQVGSAGAVGGGLGSRSGSIIGRRSSNNRTSLKNVIADFNLDQGEGDSDREGGGEFDDDADDDDRRGDDVEYGDDDDDDDE